MHVPKFNKEVLIFAPSFNAAPVVPAVLARSEPARSTMFNNAVFAHAT